MSELAQTSKDRWGNLPVSYDEHNLKISQYHVMADWERPYMERLAEIATSRGGTVLEVGYGMGIAASALQARNVDLHLVIECHPDVIARCVSAHRTALASGSMHLLTGYWQDVTPLLAAASIDGILFDTFPVSAQEWVGTHMFFFEEAYRLLKPGGVLTYFSSEPTTLGEPHLERLEQAGFERGNISFEVCPVQQSEDSKYWDASSIVAPIVVK
ncbi:class I SAM-dependent methyltransferase [Jatrophihabitans sp.]|uniref:class I SAM-dependent methyltransferase n=1 Tax=Jatrophihabitans sp. TaxID=1932789 RepID=UPI002BC0724D|nr:methyltransferase domain-containing protein [Jatrophihabitans sp.]